MVSPSGRVPCIDHLPWPLDCKISTVSSVSNPQAFLQAVITAITLACTLIFNMSEPIHENTFWDKRETDKMMEYLQNHTASAGDGSNFKDSTYQATTTYIAPNHKIKTAKHIGKSIKV